MVKRIAVLKSLHGIASVPRFVSVLLCLASAAVAWQFAKDFRKPGPSIPLYGAAPQSDRSIRQPWGAAQHLADKHLFGVPPATTESAVPVALSSPVKVIGIVSGDDALHSSAILEIDGQQHAYAAGTALPDGEKLAIISPDGVTLERNGSRYSVLMDIQAADTNARFTTLAVGQDGAPSTITSQPFKAPPSPDDAMQALRTQLIEKLQRERAEKNGSAQSQTELTSQEIERPHTDKGATPPPGL